MVGRVVQQYQLLEKLGEGGMGAIYKAQDTRLNRFVAVKILSGANSAEPERRRRFFQEAQAASALNHPNIITVHDIVTEDDTAFMVMEFITGRTLVELIPKGGLRVPQVLQYGVQMADALTAAHAAGIIHRDLKPGNVMVNDAGLVKILDFGLAKLTDRGEATQLDDKTKTMATAPLTVEGSIIGTVSYMSPEQAEGRKVDTRSDIFSFGVLLYEMATGRRAFGGDSALSTLSAILRDEAAPIRETAPDVPAQLESVIHHCLRKNPDDRFQTMQEVRTLLAALKRDSDSGALYRSAAVEQKRGFPIAIAAVAAGLVVLAGIGGGAWWWLTQRNAAQPAPSATVVSQPPPVAAPQPAPVPPPETAPSDSVLTNDSVVQMVEAKVPVAVILGQIRASKTNFTLSTTEVIRLTKAGVPASVIEAMRNPAAPKTVAGSKPVPTPSVQPPTAAPAVTTPPATPLPLSTTPAAPPPVVQPAPAAPAPAFRTLKVADNVPIRISLSEDVPLDAQPGRPIRFHVSEDLRFGDTVVVSKGAIVMGAIVDPERKGRVLGFGGGKMTFRLLQVDTAGGGKMNVRAAPARRDGPPRRNLEPAGGSRSKDLAAPQGAEYTAYVEGEQLVNIR